MALPRSEFEREMMILDGEIKRLEAEYNMFFAGRAPRLPWETRTRVDALVKRHDRAHMRNTADRFRFQSLQSKFSAFCELWERQLKQLEGGRPRPGGRAGAPPPTPTLTPTPTSSSAASGKEARAEAKADRVIQIAVRDPNAQGDRVQELYDRLAEAKQAAGEAPIPFDRVAALVRAQVDKLGAGGQDVRFRVAMKDGKVQLTVKAAGEKDD
ncbi:MAG: MXAN_5187 C-terminal domain-containing protein [Vicinamibacterales bacterium]